MYESLFREWEVKMLCMGWVVSRGPPTKASGEAIDDWAWGEFKAQESREELSSVLCSSLTFAVTTISQVCQVLFSFFSFFLSSFFYRFSHLHFLYPFPPRGGGNVIYIPLGKIKEIIGNFNVKLNFLFIYFIYDARIGKIKNFNGRRILS